jgi:hypothetical protein
LLGGAVVALPLVARAQETVVLGSTLNNKLIFEKRVRFSRATTDRVCPPSARHPLHEGA